MLFLLQWYTNSAANGDLELQSEVNAVSKTIYSGGLMVLFQEQDSFGTVVSLKILSGLFRMWF